MEGDRSTRAEETSGCWRSGCAYSPWVPAISSCCATSTFPNCRDERHFGAVGGVEPAGEVYLEPISVDALNQAMQMRAYLSPSTIGEQGRSRRPEKARDLTLLVTHDKTVEEVKLAAARP